MGKSNWEAESNCISVKPLSRLLDMLEEKMASQVMSQVKKPAANLKKPPVASEQKKTHQESDSSDGDSDDDESEDDIPAKAPAAAKKKEVSSDGSDSDDSDSESEDEESAKKPAAKIVCKTSLLGSSSSKPHKLLCGVVLEEQIKEFEKDVNKAHLAKRAASKMNDESSDGPEPPQKKPKKAPKAAKNGSSPEDDGGNEDSEGPANIPKKEAPVCFQIMLSVAEKLLSHASDESFQRVLKVIETMCERF